MEKQPVPPIYPIATGASTKKAVTWNQEKPVHQPMLDFLLLALIE